MFKFLKKDKPPKDTSSVEFKRWMAKRLDGRAVRYALERDESGTEIIIGRGGLVSTVDGVLSVICGEKTLFSASIDTLSAWEFLSLEGATLTGHDMTTGRVRTVLVYYKYHRK